MSASGSTPSAIPRSIDLARRILALAWPVLVAQLASIGMMVADTLIVGRHSTEHLAAVAVGAGIYVTLMLGLAGVVQALGPIIGHHYGAGRHQEIGPEMRQGLWLVLFLSLGGMALLAFPHPLLAPARLTPEVESIAATYLQLLALSLPASLGYRAFHAAANALGHPRPLMYIALVETLAHALLAWALVGGHLGLPGLGALGAAISQIIVTWCAMGLGFWLMARQAPFAPFQVFARFQGPRWTAQKALLRLGLPMGFSYLVEISAFTLMAIFIARLGPEVVGGHRIAANLSALTYMLPLSLALATAAQVAQAAGAGREALAWATARAGILLASGLALGVALLLWWLHQSIAGLATDDPRVAGIAAGLILYIAVYQFFDAAQTIAGFSLRAYKVSFLPLLIHLTCFWGLGLGLGYWLAFHAPEPQGAAGFWQAAVVSTVTASVLLGGLLLWVVARRRSSRA
ncbi:MATE family efflux transporter [Azovibrio restrictus]|uniref:MATE family efflux transporter n=1 Tax=Azovibrio restrictus TaxID=146938 RepID=UPI000407FAF9|nr:MATE family efflux transporter [Azovibrio restrictus]